MPSWDDVEVGDKVVMERTVEVTRVLADGFWGVAVGDKEGLEGYTKKADHNRLKSVEKPVRTFQPGDVVRAIDPEYDPGTYTLGAGRHFDHKDGRWYNWPGGFTTENYKLVEG